MAPPVPGAVPPPPGPIYPPAPGPVVQPAPGVAATEPGLSDVRWELAPIRWRGLLAMDLRSFSVEGQAQRRDLVESAILQATSYVYQPWFAQFALGITGVAAQARGEFPSNGSTLGSNGMLSVFPTSRFPFQANFERTDSRSSEQFTGRDFLQQRAGVRQSYRSVGRRVQHQRRLRPQHAHLQRLRPRHRRRLQRRLPAQRGRQQLRRVGEPHPQYARGGRALAVRPRVRPPQLHRRRHFHRGDAGELRRHLAGPRDADGAEKRSFAALHIRYVAAHRRRSALRHRRRAPVPRHHRLAAERDRDALGDGLRHRELPRQSQPAAERRRQRHPDLGRRRERGACPGVRRVRPIPPTRTGWASISIPPTSGRTSRTSPAAKKVGTASPPCRARMASIACSTWRRRSRSRSTCRKASRIRTIRWRGTSIR